MSRPDLFREAFAGVCQRPLRTLLTALGTTLGVGAFVSLLGLSQTAGNQIDAHFDSLLSTEVVVRSAAVAGGGTFTGHPFPTGAGALVEKIDGVESAGVSWTVDDSGEMAVNGVLDRSGGTSRSAIPIVAASPGLLRAVKPTVEVGRLYDLFHESNGMQVVVLGAAASAELSVATLAGNPVVYIDRIPFTVIGVLSDVERKPELLFSVVVPSETALSLWGPPTLGRSAELLADTRIGAAPMVASQIAVSIRPDAPELFSVVTPPSPTSLRNQVSSDFNALLFLVTGLSLIVGTIGIANTTLVAVLERTPEIGLRRAIGATRSQIAAQFLIESAIVGTAGGVAGAVLGLFVVLIVSVSAGWTALVQPAVVFPAPFIGTGVGVLAGLYPAIKASLVEPIEALRQS